MNAHDRHYPSKGQFPVGVNTRSQAQHAIIEYIGYYNTELRHSSLGYMTLAKFERRWLAEGKNLTEARSQ